MDNVFNVKNYEKFQYIQIPWIMITDSIFEQIKPQHIICYALLFNRMKLSIENKQKDDQGHFYIFYTEKEMSEHLNVSPRSVQRYYDVLEEKDLIKRELSEAGGANKIFVKCFANNNLSSYGEYPTEKDILNFNHVQLPYCLIKASKYSDVSPAAKILYSVMLFHLLYDSADKCLVDEKGYKYIHYSNEDGAKELNKSKSIISDLLKELVDKGLIIRKRTNYKVKTYICVPTPDSDEVNNILESKAETEDNTQISENCPGVDLGVDKNRKTENCLGESNPRNPKIDNPISENCPVNNTIGYKNTNNNLQSNNFINDHHHNNLHNDRMMMNKINEYASIIKKNVNYDQLKNKYPNQIGFIDNCINLMAEACIKPDQVKYNGVFVEVEKIRDIFTLRYYINYNVITTALYRLKAAKNITNPNRYMLTVLYDIAINMSMYEEFNEADYRDKLSKEILEDLHLQNKKESDESCHSDQPTSKEEELAILDKYCEENGYNIY